MSISKTNTSNIEKLNGALFGLNDAEYDDGRIDMLTEAQLVDYKQHLFRPYEGLQFEELKSSIKENGIISPVVVRKISERFYEILSGHNRVRAARAIGMKDIPVVIRNDLSEDKALEIVLSSNLNQRSMNDLLPSKRAAVIAQYYDLIKRTGKREELQTPMDDSEIMRGGVMKVGEKFELSGMQISRYVRINSLVDGLKHLLDDGKLPIKVGSILSDLSPDTQEILCAFLSKYRLDINLAKELVVLEKHATIDSDQLNCFFNKSNKKENPGMISLRKGDIDQFFDVNVGQAEVGKMIIKILEEYVKTNGLIH